MMRLVELVMGHLRSRVQQGAMQRESSSPLETPQRSGPESRVHSVGRGLDGTT